MIEAKTCHDCGCEEGEIHDYGCDMEDCPFCGNQIIGCQCVYGKLEIDVSEGTWAYSNGLTKIQEALWISILEEKGRIPYVRVSLLCAMCGKLYPDMFNVPNEEWKKYIISELQSGILCKHCYNKQKILFPRGWRNVSQ